MATNALAPGASKKFSASSDAKLRSPYRLRRRGAKRDKNFWPQRFDLSVEPRAAGRNFACVRFFVEPTFAHGLPLEVLHGVGDVNLVSVNSGRDQRSIEQAAGRPDKRTSGQIFAITRLFADHQNARASRSFAEHRLCVPRFHSGQPRHARAASRSDLSERGCQ